jgi:DMSO/TMAO reductase YedYZ molybdopterin-dependent catalytic subunit
MRTRSLIAGAVLLTLVLMLGLFGCGQSQQAADVTTGITQATGSTVETSTTTTTLSSTTETQSPPSTVELKPIDIPTLPEEIPGYTEVDPATGLHMTGTPQVIDLEEYRLKVTGKVEHELSLTYDEIRSLPKVTATPTLVCPGYFKDTATWSGAPIAAVLDMAGVLPDAKSLIMRAADGYATTISLEDALQPENFLAYELEGQPVPVLHGFPLRVVLPDKYGSLWVKWLVELEVD